MIIKRFFTLLIFLLSAPMVCAQADSIPQFLRQEQGLKSDKIHQARKYLIDKFLAMDMDAVKDVRDYMMVYLDDADYLALYPGEYILLLYWTQDYDELLAYLPAIDTLSGPQHRRRLLPQQDNIIEKIREKSIDSYSVLTSCIQNAELDNEEKDFLALFFDFIIDGDDFPQITQEDLNERSKEYIASYPGSKYNSLIRKNILIEFIPMPFGFMIDYSGGMGVMTASLSKSFNNFGCFGFGFGMTWNKALLNLGMNLGATTNLLETDYNGIIWSDGSRATVTIFDIAAGYQLIKNRRIAVTPFLAYGGIEISPIEKDRTALPELEDAGLKMTRTFATGIYTDFTLTRYFTFNYHPRGPAMVENVWFIRLGYTMMAPGYYRRYGSHDGWIHLVKLGIGFSSHRMVRSI
jgi:hypothetical protein